MKFQTYKFFSKNNFLQKTYDLRLRKRVKFLSNKIIFLKAHDLNQIIDVCNILKDYKNLYKFECYCSFKQKQRLIRLFFKKIKLLSQQYFEQKHPNWFLFYCIIDKFFNTYFLKFNKGVLTFAFCHKKCWKKECLVKVEVHTQSCFFDVKKDEVNLEEYK